MNTMLNENLGVTPVMPSQNAPVKTIEGFKTNIPSGPIVGVSGNGISNMPVPTLTNNIVTEQFQQNVSQTNVLTNTDVDKMVASLRPVSSTEIGQPIVVDSKSYIFTEKQLNDLLSVGVSVNPIPQAQQMPVQQAFAQHPLTLPYPQNLAPSDVRTGRNIVDTLANATLGTVNRVAHVAGNMFTGVIDVITLGYGKDK